MAAPFPSSARPGGENSAFEASRIYQAYERIARLSDVIVNQSPTEVSIRDVSDLAYVHGYDYIEFTDPGKPGRTDKNFKTSVAVEFGKQGLEWPTQNEMVTDLLALRDALIAYRAWVDANVAQALESWATTYSKTSSATGANIITVSGAEADAIRTETAKVRNVFEA